MGSAKRWIVFAVCVVAIGGVGRYIYVTTHANAPQSDKRPPMMMNSNRPTVVAAAPVQQGPINIYYQGLGTVVPLSNVTVKSRVDGELIDVLYKEGQMVKEGEVLAKIDARGYEAQLKQAEGQLLKDQALLENALIDLKRYEVLLQQDSISKQVLDTQKALVHQYQGTIKVDEAAIDTAKLQIDYSTIKAPISGRIGLRLVDKGNMVHASDTTGLATITQTNPITVTFTLPEDKIPSVLQAIKEYKTLWVEAYDRGDSILLAKGELLSLDNQIDTTTGTLKLKATFTNTDLRLFPNQFVNVHLLVKKYDNALFIPSAAIQNGSQGTYVYRINPEQNVSVQKVKVITMQENRAIIQEGLNMGDTVVIDGVDRLRDGSKVTVPSKEQNNSRPAPDKKSDKKE